MSEGFKVGDRVRLTGELWGTPGWEPHSRGNIITIDQVVADGGAYFQIGNGMRMTVAQEAVDGASMARDWGGELVTAPTLGQALAEAYEQRRAAMVEMGRKASGLIDGSVWLSEYTALEEAAEKWQHEIDLLITANAFHVREWAHSEEGCLVCLGKVLL
jgi:hypothetical protein